MDTEWPQCPLTMLKILVDAAVLQLDLMWTILILSHATIAQLRFANCIDTVLESENFSTSSARACYSDILCLTQLINPDTNPE